MSVMPMIQIPKVHFFGRRIFCELKPTDNPDMLGIELSKVLMKAITNETTKKTKELLNPKGAKIIQPN